MNDMNKVAHDLLEVRKFIAELKAEEEALVDQLKSHMVDQATETLEGDNWTASWKNVQSRRFDSKLFKHDHADLYDQYSRETTTTRFLISA